MIKYHLLAGMLAVLVAAPALAADGGGIARDPDSDLLIVGRSGPQADTTSVAKIPDAAADEAAADAPSRAPERPRPHSSTNPARRA